MSPIPNPRILYAKIPLDYPVPGEHFIYEPDAESIDLQNAPLNGGVLVKTLYISIDPYIRSRLRDPEISSYSPPMHVGKPGDGFSLVKVIRSESSKYKPGDHLSTDQSGWRAYNILPEDEAGTILENPDNIPWSAFMSVAGATAMTPFYSLRTFAKFKKGETIFVSTAAGAVGSVAVQLAKLAGLRVIGSTGDDKKVKYLEEILGVDVAFNYKKQSVWDVLKEHGPIDIYFDNVGGEQLDAALGAATPKGSRFIICGYSSEYNLPVGEEPYALKNGRLILAKAVSINGFHLFDLIAQQGMDPWIHEYLPLVKEGKIHQREHKTIGLENLPKALFEVLKGENQGKAMVVVAED